MTQKQVIFRFFRWAILIYAILSVSSRIETHLTITTVSQLSPFFAQAFTGMEKDAKERQAQNPEEMRIVLHQMSVQRITLHGITAVILAGLIVWSRKESRAA